MQNSPNETRVRDVMSRDVVCINAGENIHDALQLMVENRVASLPVVDRRGHCVGIISTSDLIDLTQHFDDQWTQLEESDVLSGWSVIERVGNSFGHERVDEVMTETIASIDPESDLSNAASLMLRNRIHRLPVVDKSDVLVGIVSSTDLLAAFAEATAVK